MSGTSRYMVVSDAERMVCDGIDLDADVDESICCIRDGAVANGSPVILLDAYVGVVVGEMTGEVTGCVRKSLARMVERNCWSGYARLGCYGT